MFSMILLLHKSNPIIKPLRREVEENTSTYMQTRCRHLSGRYLGRPLLSTLGRFACFFGFSLEAFTFVNDLVKRFSDIETFRALVFTYNETA